MSTETGAGASSFEALKAEMLKSLKDMDAEAPAGAPGSPEDGDDAKVAAAAADGEADGDADGDEGAKPMVKSMTAVDADGNEHEAIDATEILKSMQAQLGSHEDLMAKSLPILSNLLQKQSAQLKSQGELLKSMQTRLDELGGQGRGRKSTVVVAEKPDAGTTMAKSQPAAAVSPQAIFAKCLAAQKAGAITGFDVARVEAAVNNGVGIPADVLSKIQ